MPGEKKIPAGEQIGIGMTRRWLFPGVVIALLPFASPARANPAPRPCAPLSDVARGVVPQLVEVRPGPARLPFLKAAADGCPGGGASCATSAYLVSGDRAVVTRTEGGYVCAAFTGGAPHFRTTVGWLPREALADVAPSAPSAQDWAGHWASGEAGDGSDLVLDAGDDHAALGGAGPVGGGLAFIKGYGKPDGAALVVTDDEPLADPGPPRCTLRLWLAGSTLAVTDNRRCGSRTAGFGGFYRRLSGASGGTMPSDPVVLRQQPPFAKDQARLSRIAAAADGPAAPRINRLLAALDAAFHRDAADCAAGDSGPCEASRSVDLTLRGTRHLGLVVSEEWDVGAHPAFSVEPLLFDLRTGAMLDAAAILGPGLAGPKADPDVASRTLSTLYLAAVGKGDDVCGDPGDPGFKADFIDAHHHFQVWPDARRGGIALRPDDFPEAGHACEVPITVPAAAARAAGADPALLEEVEAAHRGGWFSE